MGKYIIKRLLQLIPVLIGITFLSFAMMRLAGGDAVTYMYENAGSAVSQEVIDNAKAEYGLDKPFLVQYAAWFAGMVTGDMGESYVSHRDVYETFISKLPATMMLTLSSILLTIVLAIPLGILSAVKHNKWVALQNTFPILEADLSHHPDGALCTLFTADPFMLPHALIYLSAYGADGTKGCS